MPWCRSRRWAIVVLVLLGCGLAPMLYGVWRATDQKLNDITHWLPQGDQQTADYQRFLRQIQPGEVAVVSWPGCRWDDPRLDELAKRLQAQSISADPQTQVGQAKSGCPTGQPAEPMFTQVLTGSQAVQQLQQRPTEFSPQQAAQRLQGTLIGPDGLTTCLVLVLSPAADGAEGLQRVRQLIWDVCHVPAEHLRFGGPLVTSQAIHQASLRHLGVLIAASVVLSMLLAWACLGSFRLAGLVFTGASYCQGWSVAWIYYTGGSMNPVLVMTPALVQVLALSASIHFIRYYRAAWHDLEQADGRSLAFGARPQPARDAPSLMLRRGWLPALLAAVTTALGLGSLAISQIDLVGLFGYYTALGVAWSFVVLVLYLPAVLLVRPVPPAHQPFREDALSLTTYRTSRGWSWRTLSGPVLKYRVAITVAAGLLLAFFGYGLWHVRPVVKLQAIFPKQARVLQDADWLQRHIGPMVPLEVLLNFGPHCPLEFTQRLALVAQVQQELDKLQAVGGTLSAATFAPPLAGRSLREQLDWQSAARALKQHRGRFELGGLVVPVDRSGDKTHQTFANQRCPIDRPDSSERPQSSDGVPAEPEEIWRISLRLRPPADSDYGVYFARVREIVEPILADQRAEGNAQITATLTGVTPLLDQAQRRLLVEFGESFALGFCLIGLAMVLLLRSVGAGLVAMLPNLLPITVVFGSMGWLGWGVDVAAMMTASIALGIAVDDTIHYVVCYSRGLRAGLPVPQAIERSYWHCASAMTQTAIICGLGMLVFTLSSFLPTARFSWLMAFTLATALLSDLILLPALLSGPLGRFFRPAPPRQQPADHRPAQAA